MSLRGGCEWRGDGVKIDLGCWVVVYGKMTGTLKDIMVRRMSGGIGLCACESQFASPAVRSRHPEK